MKKYEDAILVDYNPTKRGSIAFNFELIVGDVVESVSVYINMDDFHSLLGEGVNIMAMKRSLTIKELRSLIEKSGYRLYEWTSFEDKTDSFVVKTPEQWALNTEKVTDTYKRREFSLKTNYAN